MPASASVCPHCDATQPPPAQPFVPTYKSQTTAAMLSAFLGGLGIHRFYLGPTWTGVLYLLFFWTGIPLFLAFGETLLIAGSRQQRWAKKYNKGVITPPLKPWMKFLIVSITTFLSITIGLAVIKIFNPKFENKLVRLRYILTPLSPDSIWLHQATEAHVSLKQARHIIIKHMLETSGAPLTPEVMELLNKTLKLNPDIESVDAYVQDSYADIGVKLNLRYPTLYLITTNNGSTWNCITVNNEAAEPSITPKECPLTHTLKRPAPRVGQWPATAYNYFISQCAGRNSYFESVESFDSIEHRIAICPCIADRAAQELPESEIATPITSNTRQILEIIKDECER